MIDDAPVPIIALAPDGTVRVWNRAAERVLGWSAEEVVGRRCPLVDPGGAPLEPPAGEAGLAGEERACRRKDGAPITLLVSCAPTPMDGVTGRLLICHDLTARRRAQDDLEHYVAELSRSNAELENFAHVASHDLREPLRMVRSFTRLLAEQYSGRLDDEADAYIRFASEGAARMQAMIDALMEYCRVDGSDPVPTDTEDVLALALENLASAIDEAGALVTHDPLPRVVADPDQLLRVFQNLVGNAVKFRRGEPPVVHVSARPGRDFHAFTVRDNGIGIAEEQFERIFVIFKRLHRTEELDGAGMGLAICRRVVEMYGGRVWLESTPGVGSDFHFTLPAVTRGTGR